MNFLPLALSGVLLLMPAVLAPARADSAGSGAGVQLPPAPLTLTPDSRADAFQDSVRLYGRRARAGETRAQYLFGYLYEFGLGVPRDLPLAARWYSDAAKSGSRDAQFRLGMLYLMGEGVERDTRRAAELLEKAAGQGLAAAQLNLGILLDTDDPGGDPAAAARWYRSAALQGSPKAQNNLGLLYATGRGVDADVKEGMRWLGLAARQGSDDGFLNLARIYADGIGVDQDLVRAYALLLRIPVNATEGDSETAALAARVREALAQELTPAQRDEAGRLAESPDLLALPPAGH